MVKRKKFKISEVCVAARRAALGTGNQGQITRGVGAIMDVADKGTVDEKGKEIFISDNC